LYVDTGGVRLFDRFLVSDNLSVPCILGTEFIEQNAGERAALAQDLLAEARVLHGEAASAYADFGRPKRQCLRPPLAG